MIVTKFGHACVRIADGDSRLAIDPGSYTDVAAAVADLDAVLITHGHSDHIDRDALTAAAVANPALRIWAPKAAVDSLAEMLADRCTAIDPGEQFTAGGLRVRTFGGQHAQLHPSKPAVANVGYLVAESVYHPGDSFVVPTARPELALVPLNGSWAKLAETVDFAISVRAPKAFGIHHALLSDLGREAYGSHVAEFGSEYGVDYTPLDNGGSIDL